MFFKLSTESWLNIVILYELSSTNVAKLLIIFLAHNFTLEKYFRKVSFLICTFPTKKNNKQFVLWNKETKMPSLN